MSYKKIYLDTCIIRDCLKRRKEDSIELMKKVRDDGIECITGIYALLELFDIEKDSAHFRKKDAQNVELNTILRDRRNKNLNNDELKVINHNFSIFFTEYDHIKFRALVGEGWHWAFFIASSSNIESSDALHLATAIGEKCEILVTNDTHFIKEAKKLIKELKVNMDICNSKKALSLLNQG